ncbi:MAG: PIN domain-containing protein [Desulfovibrionales bacterium]|nr:MAG: PIN domain-containing protein [Desulfovibrionales bacterium]
MRLVCDTNVLVSGFLFGGHCRRIIRLISEGRIDGFITSALTAELEGILQRPKFGLTTTPRLPRAIATRSGRPRDLAWSRTNRCSVPCWPLSAR